MWLPIHPKVVHFPIALYLTGALAVVVYLWRREEMWERFSTTLLFLGWLGNIVAALTGLVDAGQLAPSDPRWQTLNQHITAGVLMWIVFGLALYQKLRYPGCLDTPARRWRYVGLIALGVLVVVVDGFIGGKLVYELRVGVQ